jgi:hypothetical protein
MNKIITLLILFTTCLLCAGCCGFYDYYVSKPGNGFSVREGGIVEKKVGDVYIYVQPDNFMHFREGLIFWPYIPIPTDKINTFHNEQQFRVELIFKTMKDGVSFNPYNVELVLNDGQILHPNIAKGPLNNLVGPYSSYSGPMFFSSQNYNSKNDIDSENRSVEIQKRQYVGFGITFDVETPDPGVPFTLRIKGLRFSDDEIEVPSMNFNEKTVYRHIQCA